MLFFLSGILIAPYFCYDFPGSLENQIEKVFGVQATEYSTLYSYYSYPNIVLPFFGGVLFDKFGTHYGILVCTLIMTLGQGLCAYAGYSADFHLLQCGRILFGIGVESLYVGQASMLALWFVNFELNFANGSSAFLPLVASTVGGTTFPAIYEATKSLGGTLLVGFFVCGGSFICALGVVLLEVRTNA